MSPEQLRAEADREFRRYDNNEIMKNGAIDAIVRLAKKYASAREHVSDTDCFRRLTAIAVTLGVDPMLLEDGPQCIHDEIAKLRAENARLKTANLDLRDSILAESGSTDEAVNAARQLRAENAKLAAEVDKWQLRAEGSERREKEYGREIDRLQVELHEANEPHMVARREVLDLRAQLAEHDDPNAVHSRAWWRERASKGESRANTAEQIMREVAEALDLHQVSRCHQEGRGEVVGLMLRLLDAANGKTKTEPSIKPSNCCDAPHDAWPKCLCGCHAPPAPVAQAKCNATIVQPLLNTTCSRLAGHADPHHIDATGIPWNDTCLGAKPHTPEAAKGCGPGCTCEDACLFCDSPSPESSMAACTCFAVCPILSAPEPDAAKDEPKLPGDDDATPDYDARTYRAMAEDWGVPEGHIRNALEVAVDTAEAARSEVDRELAGNAALRQKYGARDDETMFDFHARLAQERDAARAEVEAAWQAIPHRGAMRGMVPLAEVLRDLYEDRETNRAEVEQLRATLAKIREVLG